MNADTLYALVDLLFPPIAIAGAPKTFRGDTIMRWI